MGFYDLPKEERQQLVAEMEKNLLYDLENSKNHCIHIYSSNKDTYIRRNVYLILGRLYKDRADLREKIITSATDLYQDDDEKKRQTAIYIWTEIGRIDVDKITGLLASALKDESPMVRNGVMGGLKRMGEKNPLPILKFAEKNINDPNPEIRRIIIHGIELRGRTHPEEVLPLLSGLQDEQHPRVRKMLIHVLGQISYKKGCLEKVVTALKRWENRSLINDAVQEIISVHKRYKFAYYSADEVEQYLHNELSFRIK